MAVKKRKAAAKTRPGLKLVKRGNIITSENDNFSHAFSDLVPDDYRDSDRCIDIVQWNLEWFGAAKSREKDKLRFELVVDILATFNSELFVFQEVAGPSADGRYLGILDSVAEELTRREAGDYRVAYTNAGGEQRVAMMWDSDWLRSKSEVQEKFPREYYKKPGQKDPFAGRTPLHGHFSLRLPADKKKLKLLPGADKFDFQVMGVHLKAMEEGRDQRLESAKILTDWLTTDVPLTDNDALIMGDWNADPDNSCWAPFHELEGRNDRVHFRDINDPSDFSYLWLKNRKDKYVSRIDLTLMSLSSESDFKNEVGEAVRWKPLEETIAAAKNITDKKVRDMMSRIKETISDHLPTISRFYIAE